MSVCGQTDDGSSSEEAGAPTRAETSEQKAVSKVVRVLTVLAYLLSVSLAAILLSVYYVCVWRSPELPPAAPLGPRTDGQLAAPHGYPQHYSLQSTHYSGGSHTAVREEDAVTAALLPNSTSSSDPEDDQTSSESPTETPVSLEPSSTDVIGPQASLNDTKFT